MAMIPSPRLKREECRRTKHDSKFSNWKVLVGPSDWEDYSLGKDGVERYRTHNLPATGACTGLYELGVIVTSTSESHKTRQHDLDEVIVVYVGQADNVRTRLQQYGRTGSHLDHGCSVTGSKKAEIPELKIGPGLFKEIFSEGGSIVFRWVPIRDKVEAKKMERKLLEFFDYGWNKIRNDTCRREDILLKLKLKLKKGLSNSNVGSFSKFVRGETLVFSKKLGIKIAPALPLLEDESENKRGFLPQILKIMKSRPQLVKHDDKLHQDEVICGVAIGYGSICKNKPVPGRKRCSNHKGKRIAGISDVTSRDSIIAEDESCASNNKLSNPLGSEQRCSNHKGKRITVINDVTSRDSIIAEDESCASNNKLSNPLGSEQRCSNHKGKRIAGISDVTSRDSIIAEDESCASNNKLSNPIGSELEPAIIQETCHFDKEYDTCGMICRDGSICQNMPGLGRKRCELHKGQRITSLKLSSGREDWSVEGTHRDTLEFDICGVVSGDGLVCTSKPAPGRKRCELHRGQRIIGQLKSLTSKENLSKFGDEVNICGVDIGYGLVCRRKPVEGRIRCEEHKGMRIRTLESSRTLSRISEVCGVRLDDYSICMNLPAPGRKRCDWHKGRRVC